MTCGLGVTFCVTLVDAFGLVAVAAFLLRATGSVFFDAGKKFVLIFQQPGAGWHESGMVLGTLDRLDRKDNIMLILILTVITVFSFVAGRKIARFFNV